jgi:hypothetical protein
MKISRYIYVPLVCGILFALLPFLIGGADFFEMLFGFVSGSLMGLALQIYSDYKVRQVAPEAGAEAFKVRQQRNLVLFAGYDRAFDICLESADVLRKAKVKRQDKTRGIIEVKTAMNRNIFGEKITYRLKELTAATTEIELLSAPVPRTILLDYGEGWKAIEEVSAFLQDKNDELNGKRLRATKTATSEIYTDLSQKEKTSAV